MREFAAILAVLVAGLHAQDDRLSSWLAAEHAFQSELEAIELNADFVEMALADVLSAVTSLSDITVEVRDEFAAEEVNLRLPRVSLWNLSRVLASQAGLTVYSDPEARSLRLTTLADARDRRLKAAFSSAERRRLLRVPEGLPERPRKVKELAPGSFRLRLGDSDVDFSCREGAVVIVEDGGALLLDDGWSEPDAAVPAIQSQLARRVDVDFSADTPFEDRIEFLRVVSGLPMVVSPDAFEAAASSEAADLKLEGSELGKALVLLLAQYSGRLRYRLEDGVVMIGTAAEFAERRMGLRHFDARSGAERWSVPLVLPGAGAVLGMTAKGSALVVYTDSQPGRQAWIFVRDSGELFCVLELD